MVAVSTLKPLPTVFQFLNGSIQAFGTGIVDPLFRSAKRSSGGGRNGLH
jgi:hypothetical protein